MPKIITLIPEMKLYSRELDVFYEFTLIENKKYNCIVDIPSNTSSEDAIYKFECYINNKPSGIFVNVIISEGEEISSVTIELNMIDDEGQLSISFNIADIADLENKITELENNKVSNFLGLFVADGISDFAEWINELPQSGIFYMNNLIADYGNNLPTTPQGVIAYGMGWLSITQTRKSITIINGAGNTFFIGSINNEGNFQGWTRVANYDDFIPKNDIAAATGGTLPINHGGTGASSVTGYGGAVVNLFPTCLDNTATDFACLTSGYAETGYISLQFARKRLGLGDTLGPLAIANGGTNANSAAAALTSLGAFPTAGGTFTGAAIAQTNANYTTRQVRNVISSTANPSGGANGDVWIKYS